MGRSFLSWVSGGVNRLCFSISDKLEMDTDTEKLIFWAWSYPIYLDIILRPPYVLRMLDLALFSLKNAGSPADIEIEEQLI